MKLIQKYFSYYLVFLLSIFLISCFLISCQGNSKGTADLFDRVESLSVKTTSVIYFEKVAGFLAEPEKSEVESTKYPGIVLIHEWLGLNDYVKDMAQLLASEGFVVLAVDMYNGEVVESTNTTRARELMTKAQTTEAESSRENLSSAIKYLRALENVDAGNIASMGWSFGGMESLNLAIRSSNRSSSLQATVIHYGRLTTDKEKLKNIDWPVLGIYGSKDTIIPPERVKEFEKALNELGIPNEIHILPGIAHDFEVPFSENYSAEGTIEAFEKTIEFLNKNLK